MNDYQQYIKTEHDQELYDLAIAAIKLYHTPTEYSNPIPDIELYRKQLLSQFVNSWVTRLAKYNRKLNYLTIFRWLFNQKLRDSRDPNIINDPLIPNNEYYNIGFKVETKKFIDQSSEESLQDQMMVSCGNMLQQLKNFKEKIIQPKNFQYSNLRNEFVLFYGTDKVSINKFFYNKLQSDYLTAKIDQPNNFNFHLYNLLIRYTSLEAPGYQAAIPKSVFKVLQKHLTITHECFASPLNHTLDSYTSAYPDTDQYFGSKGNLFENYEQLFVNGGSFEANPPFLEEHITIMSFIFIEMLNRFDNVPISIIMFLPSWNDFLGFYLLHESKFNRTPNRLLILKRREHYYEDANRWKPNRKYQRFLSDANTYIFILQNNLGSKKYFITQEFISELYYEFRKK